MIKIKNIINREHKTFGTEENQHKENNKFDICTRRMMLHLIPSHPSTVTGNHLSLPLITNKLTVTDNGFSMHDETERLSTFTNWSVPFISKQSLVEDGFYYTGRADIVRCAFCQIEIGYWESGDVPNAEHKRWNPNCPLVKGAVRNNGQNSNSTNGSNPIGMDDCGFNIEHGQRNSDVELPPLLNTLGIETSTTIAYPKYALQDKRLESFKDWPISMKQKPKDLAGAGFFYTGLGDQTICFHCGIGLKDWQENDTPWEEHALWSPKCLFLRLQKGAEYISQVVAKNSAVLINSNVSNPSCSSYTPLEKSTCSSLNIDIPKQNNSTSSPSDNCHTSSTNTTTTTTPSVNGANKTKDQHEEYVGNVPVCGICYVNERSVLYLPCRHMIACVDCGTTASTCPVCRQEVKAYVKAIMS